VIELIELAEGGLMSETVLSKEFYFIGNYLCLDFINTRVVRGGQEIELLDSFDALVSWLAQAQVFGGSKAEELIRTWSGESEAAKVFEQALSFRADLRDMMSQISMGKAVPQSIIGQTNELLRHQVGYTELESTKDGFEKRFRADYREPLHLLRPIAESVCDLLCYAALPLIKKCGNEECVLFFYDTTKNHSRRWCSMSACGNRMKVATHYRRLRSLDAR
jgi:predicted RNA-binding Zn ribbon-like protein